MLAWFETTPDGHKSRRQRSIAVKGTKDKTQQKMIELLVAKQSGLYIDPSKMTAGE